MTQTQGPKDDGGSRTQEEGGKKKQATDPKVSAGKITEKSVSEIVMQNAEQDQQEGQEIGDLAYVAEEDDTTEDGYVGDPDDEAKEGPAEGEEAQDEFINDRGETDSQEDYKAEFDEQSSEGAGDASQERSGPQDPGSSQEIEDELILRHVAAVNASQKRTDEDRFKVAAEIVQDFYDGDFKAASDKNPWKKNSQKKLRDHKELEVKPRRLGDWIRAYGSWAGIHAKDPKVAPGFSNALELIAIDDEDKRYALAVEVFEKKLSVRETRKRVLEITSKNVDPRLVDKLLSKIKDPRSLPVSKDYEKMDEQFLENELSKKERLLLRAEMDTKRNQLKVCGDFLDLLEKRLSDIDL
jgi:hypothetical protein